MHLSPPVIRSSLCKHHPLVTLQFPPKTSRVQTSFLHKHKGGGSCLGFPHYVIQCITCCLCPLSLSNTSRGDSHFPVSFCAPWPPRLVTTQAETDPQTQNECVCKNYPYQFPLQNTPFLKQGDFTWGSHCK